MVKTEALGEEGLSSEKVFKRFGAQLGGGAFLSERGKMVQTFWGPDSLLVCCFWDLLTKPQFKNRTEVDPNRLKCHSGLDSRFARKVFNLKLADCLWTCALILLLSQSPKSRTHCKYIYEF